MMYFKVKKYISFNLQQNKQLFYYRGSSMSAATNVHGTCAMCSSNTISKRYVRIRYQTFN